MAARNIRGRPSQLDSLRRHQLRNGFRNARDRRVHLNRGSPRRKEVPQRVTSYQRRYPQRRSLRHGNRTGIPARWIHAGTRVADQTPLLLSVHRIADGDPGFDPELTHETSHLLLVISPIGSVKTELGPTRCRYAFEGSNEQVQPLGKRVEPSKPEEITAASAPSHSIGIIDAVWRNDRGDADIHGV